jgi:N,N-dimethylformamidase
VTDVSGCGLHGEVVNMPARGMIGHAWSASVFDFPLAPHEWSAIHFHEDDLEDAHWLPSFDWSVPDGLKSGVYAAILTSERGTQECIPFFVRPRPGTPGSRIAVIAPTMTYIAYANYRQAAEAGEQMGGSDIYAYVTDRPIELSATDHFLAEHPELGLCHYENHLDGSGTFYSSRLRPVVNMRPGYHYWMTHAPRHFAADLFLVEWLEDKGLEWDIITDEDLHAEGSELLAPYRVVLTGSHPEYWTERMLDGLDTYLGGGGRLMYLGGNGLWWVTSVHPERPHVFEVRKGVFFMPTGPGVAGETCHSTTGERGGAWRDRGRAPQRVIGVGVTAMGWGPAPGYVRQPDSFDERAAFIFEGVGPDEIIGDFGFVLGGAAGDEIDRFDRALGSPPGTLLLATTAGRHTDHYQLFPWDVQTFVLGHGGSEDKRVRADMTYLQTNNGGAVFSVGSINWIGSLMFNGGNNNVSTITENVLRRFMG